MRLTLQILCTKTPSHPALCTHSAPQDMLCCCKVFLEKLTGLQPVQKFSAFYRPRMSITPIHKLPPPVSSLTQINQLRVSLYHFLKIQFNIILRLDLPSDLPSGLLTRPCMHVFRPPYMTHALNFSFFLKKS